MANIDIRGNYAFQLIKTEYNRQRDYLNHIEDARAFVIASGGKLEKRDDEHYQETQDKVEDLRTAMLALLSDENYDWKEQR